MSVCLLCLIVHCLFVVFCGCACVRGVVVVFGFVGVVVLCVSVVVGLCCCF